MNKEIEFKAFHKPTKKLFDVYGFNKEFVFENTLDGIGTTETNPALIKDCQLIQYVGVKDKKGRKIFEGDYDDDGNIVVWCDSCMGWQMGCVDVPNKEIVINCHWCDGNFHINEEIQNFEVIGNIYKQLIKMEIH